MRLVLVQRASRDQQPGRHQQQAAPDRQGTRRHGQGILNGPGPAALRRTPYVPQRLGFLQALISNRSASLRTAAARSSLNLAGERGTTSGTVVTGAPVHRAVSSTVNCVGGHVTMLGPNWC